MKTERSFLYKPLNASVTENVKYAYRWGNEEKTSRIPSTHKKKDSSVQKRLFQNNKMKAREKANAVPLG